MEDAANMAWSVNKDMEDELSSAPNPAYMAQKRVSSISGSIGWMWRKHSFINRSSTGLQGSKKQPRRVRKAWSTPSRPVRPSVRRKGCHRNEHHLAPRSSPARQFWAQMVLKNSHGCW